MIIGITGLTEDKNGRRSIAGSGKDTIAACLVGNYRFAQVALADPMKRFCKEIFDFTDDQLWGASERRNEPDKRYIRSVDEVLLSPEEREGRYLGCEIVYEMAPIYLTPRYALQRLGTEWARDCYLDTWVDYCLRVAKRLLTEDASKAAVPGVVIPDIRFINEFEKIREAGGKVWRVKRHVASIPNELGEGHLSERELLELGDDRFDAIFPNDGGIHHLHLLVDAVMARETGRIFDYDEEQVDIPPFKRR